MSKQKRGPFQRSRRLCSEDASAAKQTKQKGGAQLKGTRALWTSLQTGNYSLDV